MKPLDDGLMRSSRIVNDPGGQSAAGRRHRSLVLRGHRYMVLVLRSGNRPPWPEKLKLVDRLPIGSWGSLNDVILRRRAISIHVCILPEDGPELVKAGA
jgi:hypothetical protein